jgi:hypothetical protein
MDHVLKTTINKLIKLSLYLFIFTNIAIFATLFAQNILTHSKFTYHYYPLSNEIEKYDCNRDNNFCYKFNELYETLGQCPINYVKYSFNIDDTYITNDIGTFKEFLFDKNKTIRSEYKKSKINVTFKDTKEKSSRCIKNYKIFYSLYRIFPIIPNYIADLKLSGKYFDPTNKIVNPFFYGETSISNIAKRYPLNIIFKPFLFIASLLMIFYWTYTKKVICLFDKSKKIQLYYYFGILSGIFLFLHVFFLGSEIENEILKNLRKYIIAFFILFELFAQFLLIKKIFFIKKLINNYINYFILKLKWFFVLFFLILTVLILSLQIFLDFPKEVDYIIEWNYFVFLSFYYLLTFFLWKKN